MTHKNSDDFSKSALFTAVGIDRDDKNSQLAVKWAIDQLNANSTIILIHVRVKSTTLNQENAELTPEQMEMQTNQLFVPYRGFCARKGMEMKEVILDDTDVAKAIINYISVNPINQIVVGASNRNAITRKFRNPDVPTSLMKAAPEYCGVYVIYKGKPITIRTAKGPAPSSTFAPRQPIPTESPQRGVEESLRNRHLLAMKNRRNNAPQAILPGVGPDRFSDYSKSSPKQKPSPPRTSFLDIDNSGFSGHPSRVHHDSFSGEIDFHGSIDFQSMDFGDVFEFSTGNTDSPTRASASGDIETEMRRLRLELKQTMEMYNAACREAIEANKKTKELQRWKFEESRKMEELRQTAEAALTLVETERARCKAAMEKAEAAQRLAEEEVHKRLTAEAKLKHELEKRTMDSLTEADLRYRKYSIDEIEVATNYFAKNLKLGEGGYGPVYKGCLDHTPVAIKVLRPDASQGRKQFRQEVEILSCIRHPNMVLLLGACPEYGCLVYEYMDYGSLEDRLLRRGDTPTIPWGIRFKIAAEIATALLFLHQKKPEPLVHRDLKPANILLDRNYISKISDVGLARLVPPSISNSITQYRLTSTAGTFCYIDPEYQQTGMLGTKSDIYSLGIMLLQIITAKSPMGLSHHVERAIEKGTFVDMLDPTITDWPVEEVLSFAKLALKCCEMRRKDRPDLGSVILPELNRLRNLGQEKFEANQYLVKSQPQEMAVSLSKDQQTSHPQVSPPWTYLSET